MQIEIQKGRPPHIDFETRAVLNRAKSEAEGHACYDNVDFVLVTPTGGKDRREVVASEWLKHVENLANNGSYERAWIPLFRNAYEEWKKGNAIPEFGTPLKMWPPATPAEIAQCMAVNVRTVEDLAAANEEALARIGMGGRALKDKAQTWLRQAKESGKVSEEVASLKVLVDRLTEENKRMSEQIEALKPRRGRPPNESA